MIQLDGEHLTLADVMAVAGHDAPAKLSDEAVARMERSRATVERLSAGAEPVYGINTGVGKLADVRIELAELASLQRNVLRSHACGVGERLERAEVRAMMLIRANVLAKGLSGIRPVVAERLCDFLNKGLTPRVPARGSVGASGDLAPLAHMALPLIGEGEAEYHGELLKGDLALRRAGLAPLVLGPKEGLSLVNGTQAMVAVGALQAGRVRLVLEAADIACALTLDALRGTPVAFDERIHQARPHPGQMESAANLRALLAQSEIRESHLHCRRVQDAYSLRCAPQVHGAVRDVLRETERVLLIELNGATDNPLVFDEEILSGGNFHGQPLAFAGDSLAAALCAISGISERRIDRLVNPALNENLPPFLTAHPGTESGLMMLQVTAAALVGENRVLATPASPGSITTSGNKEDFVSMGMTAALKLKQVVRNTFWVLALELICGARALEFLRPLRSSARLEWVSAAVRGRMPMAAGDQPMTEAIESVAAWLERGGHLRALAPDQP